MRTVRDPVSVTVVVKSVTMRVVVVDIALTVTVTAVMTGAETEMIAAEMIAENARETGNTVVGTVDIEDC